MSSTLRLWTVLGLLGLGVQSVNSGDLHHYPHYYNTSSYDETTVTLPTMCETQSTGSTITISSTTIVSSSPVYYTTTPPNTTTITISVPETITLNSTVQYPTTVPTTSITTVTVPTTITPPVSYSTYIPTLTTSVSEECPTTCSIVAGTVQLFFWPTNNDYTYPSTYADTALDYTFTSPSVYLVINTIYGTNSLGRAGPSGTSEIFALDLDEVSTILPEGQITRQLTLNDLHTDCPQSLDPAVIATTIPDGHCDFSLLAPQPVKQWALPCNACGRFGLFDPPYAIPPLGGGFIETTITTTDIEITTFASTTSPESGASSTVISATATTAVTHTTETSVTSSPSTILSSPSTIISPPSTIISPSSTTSPTPIATASASRVVGVCGVAWVLVGCFVIFWL